jgi:hypothetical protein
MDVIKAWQKILGQENVLTDSVTLTTTQTATFTTDQKIIAVIRPG